MSAHDRRRLGTARRVPLYHSVPDRYRGLIVLGAGTGVRISEALGLTNDRINWIREVTIDRQLFGQREGGPVFGPVKDKKNRPWTIPLPQTVVDALAAHVACYGLGPDQSFSSPEFVGAPVSRETFSKMWVTAAGPLGISLGDGYHQLRHFYASALIANGVSVKVVQKRLGHAAAKMTSSDVYAHPGPKTKTGPATPSTPCSRQSGVTQT